MMHFIFTLLFSLSAFAGDGTVSNFDLVDVAGSTFKCRHAVGTGVVQDCTPSQAQNVLDAASMNVVNLGSSSVIDWTAAKVFRKTLSANTALSFTNKVPGTIIVKVSNTAANYTLTWPVGSGISVLWTGSAIPTQTVGAKTDIWTIFYDGVDTFGTVLQDYTH